MFDDKKKKNTYIHIDIVIIVITIRYFCRLRIKLCWCWVVKMKKILPEEINVTVDRYTYITRLPVTYGHNAAVIITFLNDAAFGYKKFETGPTDEYQFSRIARPRDATSRSDSVVYERRINKRLATTLKYTCVMSCYRCKSVRRK